MPEVGMIMDCIILAGGLGTRLRATVPNLPKALAPIQGVPCLHLLMNRLSRFSCISKFILALGFASDQIIETIKHYPFPIDFSIETTPLGTGGAILLAQKKVESDPFFVVNGDTFFDASLTHMLDTHYEHEAELTIACKYVPQAERFGTLTMSSQGRILSFKEKGEKTGFINGGIYLFQKKLLHHLPFSSCCSLEQDCLPIFLKHKTFAFCSNDLFIDIGTPESFVQSQKLLQIV